MSMSLLGGCFAFYFLSGLLVMWPVVEQRVFVREEVADMAVRKGRRIGYSVGRSQESEDDLRAGVLPGVLVASVAPG